MHKETTFDTEVKAKQAIKIYNKLSLRFYDVYVHSFVAPVVFKCQTSNIIDLYDRNISKNHMEAGVGTGYLLSRCNILEEISTLTIVDMNKACLDYSRKRLYKNNPKVVLANLLNQYQISDQLFDSIGLNYVLHCIPGDFSSKQMVFTHLKQHLSNKGVLFGSTVLSKGINQSWAARRLVKIYNLAGVFNNLHDDLSGLTQALRNNFSNVEIDLIGNIAVFRASDGELNVSNRILGN